MSLGEEEIRILCRESPIAFMRQVYQPFKRARHHVEIAKALVEIKNGTCLRLMNFMPPRAGKSLLTTVYGMTWLLGHFPHESFIIASHSQDLANDFGALCKSVVQDPEYRKIFPDVKLDAATTARAHFATTLGGQFFAVGVGSGLTGRGGKFISIDDPIADRSAAYSPTERKALYDWYRTVLYTRRAPNAAIMLTATRWHNLDLPGTLLEEDRTANPKQNWRVLNFPMLAEEDDLLGRQPGEPLWPEQFPLEDCIQTRQAIGQNAWASLYQQRPVPEGGGMFKREWPQHYKKGLEHKGMNIYILVDPASSKKQNSDYTAMVVIGLHEDSNMYVLDIIRDRLSLTERCRALIKLHRKYKPIAVGYEQYGLQADIEYIQDQQSRENYRFSVIPLGGSMRKEERVRRLVPYFENKRVWLPLELYRSDSENLEHDLVEEFIEEELATFPASRHDDMIDAMSRILDEKFSIFWPETLEERDETVYHPPVGWMSA